MDGLVKGQATFIISRATLTSKKAFNPVLCCTRRFFLEDIYGKSDFLLCAVRL